MFKFIKMNPLFHFRKLEEEQIKPEVNRRNNKDQNRIQWVKKTECQYCTEWCLRHPWQNFVYLEFFPFKFSRYFPWQRRINDSCSLNYSKPAFTVWPPQAASVSPVDSLELQILGPTLDLLDHNLGGGIQQPGFLMTGTLTLGYAMLC